jgi:hypothetical protein
VLVINFKLIFYRGVGCAEAQQRGHPYLLHRPHGRLENLLLCGRIPVLWVRLQARPGAMGGIKGKHRPQKPYVMHEVEVWEAKAVEVVKENKVEDQQVSKAKGQ